MEKATGLSPRSVIADVGSGTGISAELFLRDGNVVFAVEPNPEMRKAAEKCLQLYSGFHSISGTTSIRTLEEATERIVNVCRGKTRVAGCDRLEKF